MHETSVGTLVAGSDDLFVASNASDRALGLAGSTPGDGSCVLRNRLVLDTAAGCYRSVKASASSRSSRLS